MTLVNSKASLHVSSLLSSINILITFCSLITLLEKLLYFNFVVYTLNVSTSLLHFVILLPLTSVLELELK